MVHLTELFRRGSMGQGGGRMGGEGGGLSITSLETWHLKGFRTFFGLDIDVICG